LFSLLDLFEAKITLTKFPKVKSLSQYSLILLETFAFLVTISLGRILLKKLSYNLK
jgi:hypothetical protein